MTTPIRFEVRPRLASPFEIQQYQEGKLKHDVEESPAGDGARIIRASFDVDNDGKKEFFSSFVIPGRFSYALCKEYPSREEWCDWGGNGFSYIDFSEELYVSFYWGDIDQDGDIDIAFHLFKLSDLRDAGKIYVFHNLLYTNPDRQKMPFVNLMQPFVPSGGCASAPGRRPSR